VSVSFQLYSRRLQIVFFSFPSRNQETQSSSTANTVSERRVDSSVLVSSVSLHRYSYTDKCWQSVSSLTKTPDTNPDQPPNLEVFVHSPDGYEGGLARDLFLIRRYSLHTTRLTQRSQQYGEKTHKTSKNRGSRDG
jgi:hypothetical protein